MNQIIPEVWKKEKQQMNFSYQDFFQTFHLSSLFKRAKIHKSKGIPIYQIFQYIFLLPFTGKTGYRTFSFYGNVIPFGKDVMYRFLSETAFQWHQFLQRLSSTVVLKFYKPLTNPDRMDVFILDDTVIHRERSKKAEYLSWVYDHVLDKSVKGYQMLTLLWSDGSSHVPLSFTLHGSPEHLVLPKQTMPHPPFHPASHAYRIRNTVKQEKTDSAIEMMVEAIRSGIQPKYVLFDSWFAFPSFYSHIQNQCNLPSICMVKKMPKVYYKYQGKLGNLTKLYAICREENQRKKQSKKQEQTNQILPQSFPPNQRGSNRIRKEDDELLEECSIYGSLIVSAGSNAADYTTPVKVVFVQNRNNKREWLAILSTDISLPDEEIIRIYGKRWSIEVFFRIIKELLKAEDEFQLLSLDSIYAHLSIVLSRYCLLSWMERKSKDDRTLGDLFYQCCEELMDLRVIDALYLCFSYMIATVTEEIQITKSVIDKLYTSFVDRLPSWIKESRVATFCEV
jgi:hypothetical protein